MIQRAEFRTVADRQSYVEALAAVSGELHLEVLGYCVMRTHSHIVIGANSCPRDLRRALQRLACLPARCALAVGTPPLRRRPWQGRFQIRPIETHAYLLHCLRYVDLNPVEARIIQRPEDFEWSSYRAHIGLASCSWLTPAPSVVALAATAEERQRRYRAFVEQGLRTGDAWR